MKIQNQKQKNILISLCGVITCVLEKKIEKTHLICWIPVENIIPIIKYCFLNNQIMTFILNKQHKKKQTNIF